jgi:Protein of unknown function (DUF1553)
MTNSKRTATVVPQQALFLMNSPMSVDVARRIVNRPEFNSARDNLAKITALYGIIFQRMPTKAEYEMGLRFIAAEEQDPAANAVVTTTASRTAGRNRMDGRAAIRNDGFRVARRPLSPWATYAQALLFSNETLYVN